MAWALWGLQRSAIMVIVMIYSSFSNLLQAVAIEMSSLVGLRCRRGLAGEDASERVELRWASKSRSRINQLRPSITEP